MLPFKELITAAYLYAFTFKDGRYRCPDGNVAPHAACCPFYALRDDLQENLFDHQCGEDTHETLRLSFHDAITYSYDLELAGKFPGGGADGSFLVFPTVEVNYPANLGTSDSVQALLPFLSKHKVSPGDLIQFAAAVGITNCPGAPRLPFLAGRPNATAPGPIGLVPEPHDSVDKILRRMADGGGFSPAQLIALLSSHSIARADHVDPILKAAPFDSTPFTFDTQIFLEVLLKGVGFPGLGNNTGEVESPLPVGKGDDVGELRLWSDFALARDPRTACTWQGFINEQEKMSNAFAAAMAKLAVNAQDVYRLVDCSEVIPQATPPSMKPATYPATKSRADIQQACFDHPFPNLASDQGSTETLIPHCPDGESDCDSDS